MSVELIQAAFALIDFGFQRGYVLKIVKAWQDEGKTPEEVTQLLHDMKNDDALAAAKSVESMPDDPPEPS